jgi:hypothetical protein
MKDLVQHRMKFAVLCFSILAWSHEAIAVATIVRSEEFGSEWPLTVRSGTLECTRLEGGLNMLWFTPTDGRYAGQRFALNGLAVARQRVPQIELIWRVHEDIVRQSRRYGVRFGPSKPVPRVSMFPLIQRGLQLCSEP